MKKSLKNLFVNFKAVTAMEYALLAGLVAISLIAGARSAHEDVHNNFTQMTHNLWGGSKPRL